MGNSYFNNEVVDITAWKGEIYVSGGFTEVGEQPLKYFAKYVGDESTNACTLSAASEAQKIGQLTITPNPALTTIDITGSAQDGPPESIHIYDTSGRDCTDLTVMNKQENGIIHVE